MGYFLGIIAKGVSHNDIFKVINPREYANGNFQTDFPSEYVMKSISKGLNPKRVYPDVYAKGVCPRE